MADSYGYNGIGTLAICYGWHIFFSYKLWGEGTTWRVAFSPITATKPYETVILEADTFDDMLKLICMREGISVERFYNSIGTVSAP